MGLWNLKTLPPKVSGLLSKYILQRLCLYEQLESPRNQLITSLLAAQSHTILQKKYSLRQQKQCTDQAKPWNRDPTSGPQDNPTDESL